MCSPLGSPQLDQAADSAQCAVVWIRLAAEQAGEHGRFADLRFPGRGEQRPLPVLRKPAQVRQRFRPLGTLQLRLVATAELLKAARIVAAPLAQLSRWRDVLAPLVERCPGLSQPPRP